MIFVKSFTSTELIAVHSDSTKKTVDKAVLEVTDEMQTWVEAMEGSSREVKVVSTSTQLVVNEYIVSYVITAIIEVASRKE